MAETVGFILKMSFTLIGSRKDIHATALAAELASTPGLTKFQLEFTADYFNIRTTYKQKHVCISMTCRDTINYNSGRG